MLMPRVAGRIVRLRGPPATSGDPGCENQVMEPTLAGHWRHSVAPMLKNPPGHGGSTDLLLQRSRGQRAGVFAKGQLVQSTRWTGGQAIDLAM